MTKENNTHEADSNNHGDSGKPENSDNTEQNSGTKEPDLEPSDPQEEADRAEESQPARTETNSSTENRKNDEAGDSDDKSDGKEGEPEKFEDDKSRKDEDTPVAKAKKIGKAIKGLKGLAAGAKGLLVGWKGVVAGLIAIVIAILIGSAIVDSIATKRLLDHTKKYGCVEDTFTEAFLADIGLGADDGVLEALHNYFSDETSSCSDGAGFTGEFYPPTIGVITSGWYYSGDFGPSGFHGATDIASYENAPIFAYAGGEVTSRNDGIANYGCNVSAGEWAQARAVQGELIIVHEPGQLKTRYAHMWKDNTIAQVGDIVSAGQHIAGQGNSGWSCGTHLHFEVHENEQRVDPIPHMEERGIVFPYTLETLPPVPEADSYTISSDAGAVNTQYTKWAAEAMKNNGMNATSAEMTCLVKLWNRESNWRVNAINPSFDRSSAATPENQAYGIPQAAPGRKMADEGADWKTNPRTQIKWGIKYIKNRYGTPCSAWNHSEQKGWY